MFVPPIARDGWNVTAHLGGCSAIRCGSCQTRYRRFAFSEVRRRRDFLVSESEEVRPPRWRFEVATRITIQPLEGKTQTVEGQTENASARGMCVRLPLAVAVGTHLSLTLEEGSARGVVRWVKTHETMGYLYGINWTRRWIGTRRSRPLARLRRRVFFRRLLLGSIALGLMAIAAAGLVWLLESMRTYNPQYYEPKDIERERYEMSRPTGDAKQQPARR